MFFKYFINICIVMRVCIYEFEQEFNVDNIQGKFFVSFIE